MPLKMHYVHNCLHVWNPRTERGGQEYREEEFRFERKTTSNDDREDRRRTRSVGAIARRSNSDDDLAAEASYYNRRIEERGFLGEAYNGATRDWTIVDVPPGTKRVTMDGIGGASEEITWQRYNGVRRAKFIPGGANDEVIDNRVQLSNRRYVAERSPYDDMWTEITKDLVVKEAIEACGYEYDETEYFFYVMDYLRYVCCFFFSVPFHSVSWVHIID